MLNDQETFFKTFFKKKKKLYPFGEVSRFVASGMQRKFWLLRFQVKVNFMYFHQIEDVEFVYDSHDTGQMILFQSMRILVQLPFVQEEDELLRHV